MWDDIRKHNSDNLLGNPTVITFIVKNHNDTKISRWKYDDLHSLKIAPQKKIPIKRSKLMKPVIKYTDIM